MLNNNATVPSTYKTVNDSWAKLFTDKNWLKYSNVQSINTLRESLQALETHYKKFAEQYLNFVKIQKSLPDARILDEYHQTMFDKAISAGETDAVNKMINVNNTIKTDLASLKDIGLLMERSLNDLNTNLDKVARTKTKNFTPFTPLNKMGETPIVSLTTNVSNTAGSSAVVQNVKSVETEGTLLPPGRAVIEIASPKVKALKNGDINTFRSYIKKDINQPDEEFKGHTPLIYALSHAADFNIIKNLIESGADLNTSTVEASWIINRNTEKAYLSPLFIFCLAYSGKEPANAEFLNYLIEKGAKPYMQSSPIKRYTAATYMNFVMASTSQRKPMKEHMKKAGIDLEGDSSLNFLK